MPKIAKDFKHWLTVVSKGNRLNSNTLYVLNFQNNNTTTPDKSFYFYFKPW